MYAHIYGIITKSILISMIILLLLVGCGLDNNTTVDMQASSGTAFAESQTPAAQSQTEATPANAAHVEEIEDTIVNVEFANIAKEGYDNLPPVAIVGDYPISQSEYRYMLNFYKSSVLLNTGVDAGADEDINFWTRTASNGKTRMEEARERVLSELQQIKIFQAIAENRGIGLEQYELENISMDLTAQSDRFGGRVEFEKILTEEYGIDIDDYWKIDEELFLRDKLIASERETISIPEDEIRDYYDQNRDIYGDMVKLRQILFLIEGADVKSERTAEETKKIAEDTLAEINNGADMDALIMAKSEEPNVASNRGQYIVARTDPYINEDELAWAFSAEVGDTCIIETTYGYYVVSLDERIARSYEDCKPAIINVLTDSRIAEYIAGWQKDPAYALVVDDAVINSIS